MLGTAPIAITVWRAAIDLCGNLTVAGRCLHQEALALDGRRPTNVMHDDPQQVLDLIVRLEYGVYT